MTKWTIWMITNVLFPNAPLTDQPKWNNTNVFKCKTFCKLLKFRIRINQVYYLLQLFGASFYSESSNSIWRSMRKIFVSVSIWVLQFYKKIGYIIDMRANTRKNYENYINLFQNIIVIFLDCTIMKKKIHKYTSFTYETSLILDILI